MFWEIGASVSSEETTSVTGDRMIVKWHCNMTVENLTCINVVFLRDGTFSSSVSFCGKKVDT